MKKLQLTIVLLLFLSNLNACVPVSAEEAHASLWPTLKSDIINSFNNEKTEKSLVTQLIANFKRTYKKGENPFLSMKLILGSKVYDNLKTIACSSQGSASSAQLTGCGTLNKDEICCCQQAYV